MNRLLELTSKTLAVVGVLALLYAASGVQEAKAQQRADPCITVKIVGGPLDGFFTCNGTQCAAGRCCQVPTWDRVGDVTKTTSYNCCLGALVPCPPVPPAGG